MSLLLIAFAQLPRNEMYRLIRSYPLDFSLKLRFSADHITPPPKAAPTTPPSPDKPPPKPDASPSPDAPLPTDEPPPINERPAQE